MKRRIATLYAALCTLLAVAGFATAFYFAWQESSRGAISCLIGLALSLALAPLVHELGHLCLGKAVKMECVYMKAFCMKNTLNRGKLRFAFASPFAPDHTQMLPKKGGNMRARAGWYALGGLLFSLAFLCLLIGLAVGGNAVAWGSLPYVAYLFLLNALPFEYASGKTDMQIFVGLMRGEDAEKCMLSAMEIQGQLYEGKCFSEIDEKYYFDLPQLMEEEPLYAVLLDLRYRYYLDKGDLDGAADALNRLAYLQPYLSDGEVQKIAGELTYMHALRGDEQAANESGKLCREFLEGDSPSAKRILAAYSQAFGKTEAVQPLIEQANAVLEYERVAGVRKFEEKLLLKLERE